MPSVVVTIRKRSWEVALFNSSQMRKIGQALLDAEKARMRSGRTVSGGPDRALGAVYASRKLKQIGVSLRNMVLSGATMNALQVKRATKNTVTVGPTTPLARLILAVANKIEPVWGKSKTGLEAANKEAREQLKNSPILREI